MRTVQNPIAAFISVFLLLGCSQELEKIPAISFVPYSVTEKGNEWSKLEYPHDDKIIVINDYAELEKYIAGSDTSSLPSIDFSQETLLLAQGITPYANRATIRNCNICQIVITY